MLRCKHLLSIVFLLACALAHAQRTEGYGSLPGYPYVLIADDAKGAMPALTDSAFNRIATGIKFQVNRTEVDKSSDFYKTCTTKLLPLLNSRNLYPVGVYIRGAASPEGPYENNCRLGRERTTNLIKLLCDGLNICNDLNITITGKVINEDYAYLALLMQQAGDKDAVRVQQLMDSCQWVEQKCKTALQKEQGGRLWARLLTEYFPHLRTARAVIVVADAGRLRQEIVHTTDTIYMRDTVYVSHTTVIDSTTIIYRPHPGTVVGGIGTQTVTDTIMRHPVVALKTNLLFDVITALNASVEVPIGNHFSVSAEVIWPWWVDKKNQWCMEMGSLGLEGRYYFGRKQRHSTHTAWRMERTRPLTGFFLGVHGDACYYDFEWKGKGRQGEAWVAGLTLGYQKRLSRYFNMEFSLGLGGGRHRYRTYDATELGDHLWRRNTYTNKTYIGPTKAKISLVWMLYSKCGKKGGAK